VGVAEPRLELLEKLGFDLSLRGDNGRELAWEWGPAHHGKAELTVAGATSRAIAGKGIYELPAVKIALGKRKTFDDSKKIMAKLDIAPGQTGRLRFSISSIGIARGDEAALVSEPFEFRVEKNDKEADGKAQFPRHKLIVTCFNGDIDSRSKCSTKCFGEDGSLEQNGKMRCRFPGKESEIEWKFVEYSGDKDVYQFTVISPLGSPDANTTRTEVKFGGRRVTVLRDDNQVVVLDPPAANEAEGLQ
jgi:hypothetical protein